jgi:GT2 family glycosyltransferase
MDVSIIIPYHKRKDLFLNQLASLRRSDYPRSRMEIVLVEDGSEDFRETDLSSDGIDVKYYWNEKKDPTCHTPPRNRGVEIADGEILVFLDCDQIVPEGFVREHVEFHRRHEGDLLQIGTRKEMHPDQDIDRLEDATFDEDVRVDLFRSFDSDGSGMLAMWSNVWSHNISIPREMVRRHGGFDEGFRHWGLEDQEFGLRMERCGAKIRYNPAIEVHHQYHKPAWGSRIRKGWLGNYAQLVEKYPDDPAVRSIALLGEVLDPSIGLKVKVDRVRGLSKVFYTKMEIIARCLSGAPVDETCLRGLPLDSNEFYRQGVLKWS